MLLGPGHRHIEEPVGFLLLALADVGGGQAASRVVFVSLERPPPPRAEPVVLGEQEARHGPGSVSLQRREDGDGELQALGGMHRQDLDRAAARRVRRVLLGQAHFQRGVQGRGYRVQAGRALAGPPFDPVQEAVCVGEGFQSILPLPQKRPVAGCGDGARQQEARRHGVAVVPALGEEVAEARQARLLVRLQFSRVRRLVLKRLAEIAAVQFEPEQARVAEAAERRLQHRRQADLVAGVAQNPEERRQFGGFRGPEQAPAAAGPAGHAALAQGGGEAGRLGVSADQNADVVPLQGPGRQRRSAPVREAQASLEFVEALREPGCLALQRLFAAMLHDQRFDARLRLRRELVGADQAVGFDPRARPSRQQAMHGFDDLAAAAKILREADHFAPLALDGGAVGAEHVLVGVPEPVDRLVDVAHDEADRTARRMRREQAVHELHLQRIRVLELVDQDVLELELRAALLAQQGGRLGEHVVEIEPAGFAFGFRERLQDAAGRGEQPLARNIVGGRHERRPARGQQLVLETPDEFPGRTLLAQTLCLVPRFIQQFRQRSFARARRGLDPAGQIRQLGALLGFRHLAQRGSQLGPWLRGRLLERVAAETPDPVREIGQVVAQGKGIARAGPRTARRVSRQEFPERLAALGERFVERPFDRGAEQAQALRLVEHLERRIDARVERVFLQQPTAERVDGRDLGVLEPGPSLWRAALRPEQASAHFVGGLLRERDGENALRRNFPLQDEPPQPFHQDASLAGAGPRGDADISLLPTLDGSPLGLGQRHRS